MTDDRAKAKAAQAKATGAVRRELVRAVGRAAGRARQRLRPWRPAGLRGSLAFAALLTAVALRDHFDATAVAAVGFDLAPRLAALEGAWLEALVGALPTPLVTVAAAIAGSLPLFAALATGFAIASGAGVPTARLAWLAAAVALPPALLVPLSEPAASGLVAIAPAADRLWAFAPFAWFDADRDALLSLPLTALFLAFVLARRAGHPRHARIWLALFALQSACAIASGEVWFTTVVLSVAGALAAERLLRTRPEPPRARS